MTLPLLKPVNGLRRPFITLALGIILIQVLLQWWDFGGCTGFPLYPSGPPRAPTPVPSPGSTFDTDLDLPDISEQWLSGLERGSTLAAPYTIRLPLQHKEIPASHMGAFARFKPHLMVEDNALHSWSSLPTHSPHWERRETTEPRYDPTAHPSIDLTLTEIPKSYGYTASFSIGTPPSNSSDIDATEAFTKAFDLLVDTGSGLIVVTSSSCLDPECVQVQNRFNCQASVTCHPYHPPTDMAKSDAGSEMGDRKTQDRIGKQDQGGLKSDGSRWFQIYGDGTIANGTLVLDSVRFSLNASIEPQKSTTPLSPAIATQPKQEKVEVKNQPFLVVDQPGLFLFKSYGPGVDGIAGFSLGVPGIQPTLLHNLRALQDTRPDSSSLFTPTPSRRSFMSLWLREGDNFTRDHGGELLINAVDRSRFRGPIHWNMRGPSAVDWSVPLDGGIALAFPDPYNGTSSVITLMAPSSFMSSSSTLSFSTPSTLSGTDFAVLDSGSAGIYFQRPLYHALFESIPGARQQMNGYWRVPCTGSAELRFGIGSQVYSIPYADWVKPLHESVSVGPFRPRPHSNHISGSSLVENSLGSDSDSGSRDDSEWPREAMCQARIYGSSPGPILLGTTFLKTVYSIFDYSEPGSERIGFASLR